MKDKIALFCDIDPKAVIEAGDADTLYSIPLDLQKQGLDSLVCSHLKLDCREADMEEWKELVKKVKSLSKTVTIALVGKYVELPDAYISVVESLRHAGYAFDADIQVKWINAEEVTEDNVADLVQNADGILVPGGFGDRGVEGKITTVKYAREQKIPFFGICLGMQVASIEYARNVLGLEGAHSAEIDPSTPYPIIDLLPEQKDIEDLGGTLRLGLYPCKLQEGRKRIRHMKMKWSMNATATAMNSTTNSDSRWKKPDLYFPGQALTAVSWRLSSLKIIHGLSRLSSTLNSRQDRQDLRLCSETSYMLR